MKSLLRVCMSVVCACALVSCGVQGTYDSTKDLRESLPKAGDVKDPRSFTGVCLMCAILMMCSLFRNL